MEEKSLRKIDKMNYLIYIYNNKSYIDMTTIITMLTGLGLLFIEIYKLIKE